jgi:prevent-host-death family protein
MSKFGLQTAEGYSSIAPMKTQLVSTLKRQATRILAEVVKDRSPVLITQHGIPTAYLVDVVTFEALQNRMRLLEGIARGERAIGKGGSPPMCRQSSD